MVEEQLLPDAIEENEKTTLDDFLKLGRYVFFLCVIWELGTCVQLANMLYMVYAGAAPKIVGCGQTVFQPGEGCTRLKLEQAHGSCKEGPILEMQFYSVNVEFDYLCEETQQVKNSISHQMIFMLIGAVIFGHFSDSFGRKLTLLLCMTGMAVTAALSTFANSLTMFTIARCACGLFTGGQMTVLNVYILEHIPKRHRVWLSTIITWSPNFVIFGILGYFMHTWRNLAMATSLLTIPSILLLVFAYESPRWLMQKQKIEEARTALEGIAKWNGRSDEKKTRIYTQQFCDKQLEAMNGKKHKTKHYYFIHLFYTWKLARYSLIMAFCLFTTSIVNYGLLFNMEKLSGSLFLNSIFFGLFRWTLNISAGLLDYFIPRMGRKLLHMGAMSFVIAALSIVLTLYLLELAIEWHLLVRLSILAAAAMTSQLYLANVMTAIELYPTAIRNVCAAFLSTFSRTATILAPQIFILSSLWSPGPYLMMTIMCAVDLLVFELFIPETKGRPMNEQMPQPHERIFAQKPRGVPPLLLVNNKPIINA